MILRIYTFLKIEKGSKTKVYIALTFETDEK